MKYVRKILTYVLGVIFFSWSAITILTNWIGRSTLEEDWDSLVSEKLPVWLDWLLSTPWPVTALLATILTASLVFPVEDLLKSISTNRRKRLESPEREDNISPVHINVNTSGSIEKFIPLEWKSDFTFDCSQGHAFHVILRGPSTLTLPKNPQQGSYRLYITNGQGGPYSLTISGYDNYAWSDFSASDEEGGITVLDIDIFWIDGMFKYYFRITTSTSANTRSVLLLDFDSFKPTQIHGCRASEAETATGLMVRTLTFDAAAEESAIGRISVPEDWMDHRVKFRLRCRHGIGEGDSAVFAIHGPSDPEMQFEEPVFAIISRDSTGRLSGELSESSSLLKWVDTTHVVKLTRKVADHRDTCVSDVTIDQIEIVLDK